MKLLSTFMLTCLMLGLSARVDAQTDYSGSWYNPARNGEGFHIQLLDNGQALVIWFTYPGTSDNSQTEQSWITGIGEFDGSKITITNAIRASGPIFGEGYDQDDLNRMSWGDLNVAFSGPDSGVVNYDGLDGTGSTQISRITTLIDTEAKSSLPPGISGAWFDPATDGQGWFVEILSPSAALVYWFTYDQNGNQAWNLGVGEIFDKEIVLPENLAGKGTRFGDEFNPADVVLTPFGMLKLRFDDCASGEMNYLLTNGQDEGSFPLIRLTSLASKPCSSLPGPTQDQAVMINATDPLATQYTGQDNIQVNLFGKKDGSGRVDRLSSGNVRTAAGNSVLFDISPDEPLILIQDTDTGITITTELDNSGNYQIVLNDPENGVSAALGASAQGGSASAAVKSAKSFLQSSDSEVPGLEAGEAGTALVPVELCGEPATTAQVNFLVGDSVSIPAVEVAAGQYQADIPTRLSPSLSDDVVNDVCETTTQQFTQICNVVSGAGIDSSQVGASDICNQLGLQVAEIKPAAAVNAAAVCSRAIAAFSSACAANELRTANCGPSPTKVFRDFAVVEISVEARVPGLVSKATAAPRVYENPADQLVFPTIDVPGQPYYLSHSVSPALPIAGESYTLSMNTGCIAQGTSLTVANQTTGSSTSCTVDSGGRCEAGLSSNSDNDTNEIEITGPGGFRHQLVQALENSSDGSGNGIWRLSFVEDGETLNVAFSINHPEAFLCEFSDPTDVVWGYLSWDSSVGYYVESEDGDVVGINIENGEDMCFFASIEGESASRCVPATKASSWSEASQGDGGSCATPSWLSN